MAEDNPVERLKQRMAAAKTKEKASPAEGSMSGERPGDEMGQVSDRAQQKGMKSIPEKQAVAEEKTALAKAGDVEDTREESSGDERHDLIIPSELNIPPTIVQERLRLGQNPATGEPWSREERMKYDKLQEQSRQEHSRAVRESELRMRDEQAQRQNENAQIQPTPHVPVSQLTEDQRKAMQKAQDSGKGALAQAAARDANSPDAKGRKEADEADMTKQQERDEEREAAEEIERQELGEVDDDCDEEKDADEVQAELDQK